MKFTKFVSNFDYILFITTIILTIIGIFFIYSANLNKPEEIQKEFLKQIVFFTASIILLIIILFIPGKNIQNFALWFYIICLIGLFITLFFPTVKGQKRFIILNFSFQFSEIMKIATILLLAKFYSNKTKKEIKSLFVYLQGLLIILLPTFLILLQSDLGTLLVYFPILLFVSFIAGIKKRYLLYTILFLFFISFIPIITSINKLFFNNENETMNLLTNTRYVIISLSLLSISLMLPGLAYFNVIKNIGEKFKKYFYWYLFFGSIVLIGLTISYPTNSFVLQQYQKDRLMIFFNPNFDPKGKGYNIIQSRTTIGNGGLFGQGWCKGEQIQNFFLPEQATDFIYPVIAEEKGFLGSLLILFLYSLIFFRGFYIIINTRYYWEAYVIIGILSMYLFHIVQNIGMCVGIMPITGIPLPFLSYGGSFLITCFIGTGLMMNIELNRYQY